MNLYSRRLRNHLLGAVIAFSLLFLFLPCHASAQAEGIPDLRPILNPKPGSEGKNPENRGAAPSTADNPPAELAKTVFTDEGVKTAFTDAVREEKKYEAFKYTHSTATFKWQYIQSIVLFILVVALVVAGIVFSAMHFFDARRGSRATSITPSETTADNSKDTGKTDGLSPATGPAPVPGSIQPAPVTPSAIDLELSMQGVKVKTSLIGFGILVVSMAFLYLYILHVFPITEVTASPVPANAGTNRPAQRIGAQDL